MSQTKRPKPATQAETYLPPMTYGDLHDALQLVAAREEHRAMIPYLVSALRQQAPFLTGQLTLFEILRTANCMADVQAVRPDS